ncbi:MAG: Mth938-like domain-containing protein [Desulfurococcales archaeon]|nr:Mth938-like domain-containing protein [Desulfurococcales archaeon]
MPQPLIDDYDFGVMIIRGKVYKKDLIITPKAINDEWWRIEGHRLQIADVRDYVLEDVDAVVIGTGYDGLMSVDDEVIKVFKDRGKEVLIAKTKDAVNIYNDLVSNGRKVLGFFHLTC